MKLQWGFNQHVQNLTEGGADPLVVLFVRLGVTWLVGRAGWNRLYDVYSLEEQPTAEHGRGVVPKAAK